MANTTATAVGNQQLYNDFVLKGFVATIAPLRSFSFDASPAPGEKGQSVNMTFVASGSAASSWTEANGYTISTGTRAAITVALSNHQFVGTALTDIEIANSSLMRLEDQALMDGRRLGLTVLSDVISAITGSTHSNGYNFASSSLVTVDGLVAVRKVASQLSWGLTRNIILNVNGFGALLLDDDLKYIYRGDSNAVQNGTLQNIFGWQNVYEASGYPTTLVSGSNTQIGCAVTPDALAVAMRYLTPAPEAAGIVEAYPLTDQATGITLGYRKWYDPDLGKVKSVYECVWGKTVGNPNGAINLTATVDV